RRPPPRGQGRRRSGASPGGRGTGCRPACRRGRRPAGRPPSGRAAARGAGAGRAPRGPCPLRTAPRGKTGAAGSSMAARALGARLQPRAEGGRAVPAAEPVVARSVLGPRLVDALAVDGAAALVARDGHRAWGRRGGLLLARE